MSFYLTLVSILITLTACFVVLCRIDKLKSGVTKPEVFIQHAALGLGLFCAAIFQFLAEGPWALISASSGVVVFFGMSARRWSRGAPNGTSKPAELDLDQMLKVNGGTKPRG